MRRSLRLALGFALAVVAAPAVTAQPVVLTAAPGAGTISYEGSHPLHGWRGTSEAATGTVRLDPSDPSSATVTLVVPVSSFDSGNGNRDSNMMDVVDADRHPEVRFVSERVTVERWAAAGDGYAGTWRVAGTLTFHGVERPVEIPVAVTMTGGALDVEAAFAVALSDHDVKRPSLLFMKISDEIELDAALRFTPSR